MMKPYDDIAQRTYATHVNICHLVSHWHVSTASSVSVWIADWTSPSISVFPLQKAPVVYTLDRRNSVHGRHGCAVLEEWSW